MRPRNVSLNPEVTPQDLESPYNPNKVYGGGRPIQPGLPNIPNIQPFQQQGGGRGGSKGHGSESGVSADGLKKAGAIAAAVWLGGWFLGYDMLWPLYLLLDLLGMLLSMPPFSWVFGWLWTPLSWVGGIINRGAPVVAQQQPVQELRLHTDQVSTYLQSYVEQYGEAALIFASHDGYPQIVAGLLFTKELGYAELIDAADESGNTALIYASSKGFPKTVAALLRAGADPDVANHGGGGRTPLMEAAGGGFKDIVSALRLVNATLDMVDDYGNTALHYAAYHGHYTTVVELVKGNARKDIQNSYGHTPASYAASNRHKSIADYLNRQPTKRERAASQAAGDAGELDLESLIAKQTQASQLAKQKEELQKQVKAREEPKPAEPENEEHSRLTDLLTRAIMGQGSDSKADATKSGGESKELEDQLASIKRQHEEAELKSQKRIVELLEKSSDQQKAVDDAARATRDLQLNNTELQLRLAEIESKHQASELRSDDERRRADRLQDEISRMQADIERHRNRAETAERERDLHMDAARRHEENLRQKHEEVRDHVSRLERQSNEIAQLREDLRRRDAEVLYHKDRVSELQRGSTQAGYTSEQSKSRTPEEFAPSTGGDRVSSENGAGSGRMPDKLAPESNPLSSIPSGEAASPAEVPSGDSTEKDSSGLPQQASPEAEPQQPQSDLPSDKQAVDVEA